MNDEELAVSRMRTGIPGFDEIAGGLPRRGVTVVLGGAGAGKTILAMQVLATAARELIFPPADGHLGWRDTARGCSTMGQKKELKKRRARRTFTAAKKADAVRLVKSGKSVAQVARELDLTTTSLHVWVLRDSSASRRRFAVRPHGAHVRVALRRRRSVRRGRSHRRPGDRDGCGRRAADVRASREGLTASGRSPMTPPRRASPWGSSWGGLPATHSSLPCASRRGRVGSKI